MFKAQVELKFFGWENDPSVNADKIWGYALVEGKLYAFWGRRGSKQNPFKSIRFMRWQKHDSAIEAKARDKLRGGYREIGVEEDKEGNYPAVERVYPGFSAHMKKQLMMARLSGTVQGEEF